MDAGFQFFGSVIFFAGVWLWGRYSAKADGYDAGYIAGLRNARDLLEAASNSRTPEQPE